MFKRFNPEDNYCMWLGRNGRYYASGIEVTRFTYGKKGGIIIEPVKKNGIIGRCYIEIPLNAIDDVCKMLQDQKANLIEENKER